MIKQALHYNEHGLVYQIDTFLFLEEIDPDFFKSYPLYFIEVEAVNKAIKLKDERWFDCPLSQTDAEEEMIKMREKAKELRDRILADYRICQIAFDYIKTKGGAQ